MLSQRHQTDLTEMQSEAELMPVLNQSDVDRSTREFVVGAVLPPSAIAYQQGLRPTAFDPERLLSVKFDQLRVAENFRSRVFFEIAGHRYVLRIERELGETSE